MRSRRRSNEPRLLSGTTSIEVHEKRLSRGPHTVAVDETFFSSRMKQRRRNEENPQGPIHNALSWPSANLRLKPFHDHRLQIRVLCEHLDSVFGAGIDLEDRF